MMRIIGIIMTGLASLILISSGILVKVYSKELMQWSATPPTWVWWVIAGVFLFGVIGFFIGLIGD